MCLLCRNHGPSLSRDLTLTNGTYHRTVGGGSGSRIIMCTPSEHPPNTREVEGERERRDQNRRVDTSVHNTWGEENEKFRLRWDVFSSGFCFVKLYLFSVFPSCLLVSPRPDRRCCASQDKVRRRSGRGGTYERPTAERCSFTAWMFALNICMVFINVGVRADSGVCNNIIVGEEMKST